METMLPHTARPDVDLVTNVGVRTFPRGYSVELARAPTFAPIGQAALTDEEREHLTKVYYNHPDRFRIINIESGEPGLAERVTRWTRWMMCGGWSGWSKREGSGHEQRG